MSKKMTDWFPSGTKPVRVGVYMTQLCEGAPFSKWDGKQWMDSEETVALANKTKYIGYQYKSWRGLASDPKAKP